MNCAWCNPSDNGTDGICDNCMQQVFGVDPASIHAEIAAEQGATATTTETSTEELEVVNA